MLRMATTRGPEERDLAVGLDRQAFELYRQAVKAVPAVRYALGVAGIVAVIAIIGALQLDAWTIALAAPAMAIAMVLLVLFAKFASLKASALLPLVLCFAWGFLVLGLASASLGTLSIFFGWPIKPDQIPALLGKATQIPALPAKATQIPALPANLPRPDLALSDVLASEVARRGGAATGQTFTWLARTYDTQPSDQPTARVRLLADDTIIDAFVQDTSQLQRLHELPPRTSVVVRGTVKMPYERAALRLVNCEISVQSP
jgi:hypothetical protein